MSQIRNFRVAAGTRTEAGGALVLYTVPAGHSFILKSLGAFANTVAASTVIFGIQNPPTTATIYVFSQPVESQQSVLWSGWTVLNEGDIVFLSNDAQPVHYWVAGALLPFAPAVPPQAEPPVITTGLPEPPLPALPESIGPIPPTIYLPNNLAGASLT